MSLNLKKLFSPLAVMIFSIAVSGCFPDLGDFSDEEAYCDSFDDVILFDKDADSSSYDFGDFYYEDIGKEFQENIPIDYYSYMFVEIAADMNLQEIYLYVKGEESGTLTIEFSICKGGYPSNLRGYDDPDTKENDDGEEETIDYDDITALYTTSTGVSSSWRSFGFNLGKEGIEVTDSDYICFKFVNNTYDGKKQNMEQCSFEATALIIRALEI